jgi:FtsP/CotA-like multicopper oxidase with cupredoxin domain
MRILKAALPCVLLCAIVSDARSVRALAPQPPEVLANDNRAPAGTLNGGVLELKLEILTGFYHPEAQTGVRLAQQVFAEAGRPPVDPGPLIRVPAGTEVRVAIHNTLKTSAVVHGLYERPGPDVTPLDVPAGATGERRFRAGAPGTYFYWATTTGAKDYGARDLGHLDPQLVGAFIIDPPGGSLPDRVFVLNGAGADEDAFHDILGTFTINGKSWPFTEHMTYPLGERARWRWINVSTTLHPLHLHGAYFNVVAAGNMERDETYDAAATRMVVTEALDDGGTMTMEWAPEREGRWVFHCHLAPHFSPDNQLPHIMYPDSWGPEYRQPPDPMPGHMDHTNIDTDAAGMAGLVLGITVTPGAGAAAPLKKVSEPARKLELVAHAIAHGAGNAAKFAYTLRENGRETATTGRLISPPIVLTRHQPVEVSIVNQLKTPTAVHWHGIELDSYYDGVPGWGGLGRQITPPIAAGSAFVARFAPPRAGTFIYHTHWHDLSQITGGLYGPLIVLPEGERFDPDTDRIVLVSSDGPAQKTDDLLVSGTSAPEPTEMRVGTRYRFRFINITSDDPEITVALLAGDAPVNWRAIAKDGADLPGPQRLMHQARQRVSVGETYDFEFVPERPGLLTLDVFRPNDKRHVVTAITVR